VSFAAAGYWVAGHAGFALSKSPNEKLNISGVGVGDKGRSDVDPAGKFGNVVAIGRGTRFFPVWVLLHYGDDRGITAAQHGTPVLY
jgi:hypothetical protein